MLEITQMFGSQIEMQPDVPGNSMEAKLDITKSHALGWLSLLPR